MPNAMEQTTLVVWLSVLDARSGITRNVSAFQTQSTLNPQLYGLVMHVLTICSYAYLSSACISIMHDMNLFTPGIARQVMRIGTG